MRSPLESRGATKTKDQPVDQPETDRYRARPAPAREDAASAPSTAPAAAVSADGAAARPSPGPPIKPSRGLPPWGPRAVVGATAVIVLGALVASGNFGLFGLVIGTAIVSTLAVWTWSRVVEGKRRAKDRLVTFSVTSAFLLALSPLVSLLYTVILRGSDRFDYGLFSETMRGVLGEGGGALHAAAGTLIITLTAAIISIPIGVMAAIYLHEYGRSKLSRTLTFFVDVMTGIPSIVAGLFAVALFSLLFGPGTQIGFMGSLALCVLMIPIVVRSTEEMLRIVPNGLRESSYALGVSKWRTICKVVLPTALSGIVTGGMIAIARVVGETAPLLITTGTLSSLNLNPFSGGMENLPVFTYSEFKFPGVPPEPFIERAWGAALMLIAIVMILFVTARLISRRYGTELR